MPHRAVDILNPELNTNIAPHTAPTKNITHPSAWNGWHLLVSADLCCEPGREGRSVSRRSPASGGREGLKEIARGREGNGKEEGETRRHGKSKVLRQRRREIV